MEYNSFHIAVLQLISGCGTLEKAEFESIFEQLKTHYSEELDVSSATPETVIETINEKIALFDLSIRLVRYEYTDEEFYIYISTTTSPESKLQNLYTEAEIQYFPLLMKEIITSDEYCISSIMATNLITRLPKPMPQTRSVELLDEWKSRGYFTQIGENVFLGPRAIEEFQGYITANYQDFIKACFLCQKTVFKESSCKTSSCEAVFHATCINRYHEKSPNTCIACKNEWA
ncbi:non-structural maintenance of chromosomes element 1 homolog [Phlebotomus argentipes]|uniref:non-structural maintenance of chromosomes element 1 homolog n=1 Tax=Phlebotomus argentipes TaxID=94469 RepID=UPI0028930335|nr:non-structural maintenance of chromosomes element 1 homolog [Phlebotomus argentipes]